MTKAAAYGWLDFKDADSYRTQWLLKEMLVLEQLDQELMARVLHYKQLQQAVTAVWPAGDTKGEMWQAHWDRSLRYLTLIGQQLLPYLKWDIKDTYKSDMEKAREEWVARFGDPRSPEVKAKIAKALETAKRDELLKQQEAEAQAEDLKRRAERQQQLEAKKHRWRKPVPQNTGDQAWQT